jgi:hypothetical protein
MSEADAPTVTKPPAKTDGLITKVSAALIGHFFRRFGVLGLLRCGRLTLLLLLSILRWYGAAKLFPRLAASFCKGASVGGPFHLDFQGGQINERKQPPHLVLDRPFPTGVRYCVIFQNVDPGHTA